MNEGLITNLRTPDSDGDATNKKYVDSLIGTTAPNITSTPTMTSSNTTINGLTYVTVASSMSGSQTRAWRAFTNEVVTPGSPASNSGWVPSAKDATPWIQMHYPRTTGVFEQSTSVKIHKNFQHACSSKPCQRPVVVDGRGIF